MLDAHTFDLDRTMASKDTDFYEQLGQRIAEFRKATGMTQTDLAEQLGIAQQTMAHYEGGKSRIAVAMLPTLARALSVSIETLIGETEASSKPTAGKKRGPAPKIQQQLEQLSRLPKTKQRAVMQVLESVLAQSER